MGMGKVVIGEKEVEFSFGVGTEEIERNKEKNEDTIDLKEVVEKINGQNKKDWWFLTPNCRNI